MHERPQPDHRGCLVPTYYKQCNVYTFYSLVTIQTAAAALSSLATLSLSSSPPPAGPAQLSTSFAAASDALRPNSTEVTSSIDLSVKQEDVDRQVSHDSSGAGKGELSVGGITIKNGTGKKRGTIFQCESCSKVCMVLYCVVRMLNSVLDVPSSFLPNQAP